MILAIYCNKLTSAKTLHPEQHFIEEFQNKLPLMKKKVFGIKFNVCFFTVFH